MVKITYSADYDSGIPNKPPARQLDFVGGRTPHRTFRFMSGVPLTITEAQYSQEFAKDSTVQQYDESGNKVDVPTGKAYFVEDVEFFLGNAKNVDIWTIVLNAKEKKKFGNLLTSMKLATEKISETEYKVIPEYLAKTVEASLVQVHTDSEVQSSS